MLACCVMSPTKVFAKARSKLHAPALWALNGKAAFVFVNELGLERALAVARDIDAQDTCIGQHGFGAFAVAVMACSAFGFGLPARSFICSIKCETPH